MGLWMFEIDHILETVVENEYKALLANCLFPPPIAWLSNRLRWFVKKPSC